MRDRLTELLEEAGKKCIETKECRNCVGDDVGCLYYLMANHLLANDVVAMPCKVGQTVYIPWVYGGTKGIAFFEVTHIIMDYRSSYVRTNFETDDEGFWEQFNGGQFDFEDFGETVFLTSEEAEKALAERKEDK